MSEISKPFPSAPATSPSRDPRRLSRQENPSPHVSSVPSTLPAPTYSKPKSYGEKLIESLAGLSTEVSTTTALKNEYARAKKAQAGVNLQYDKLKNLSQFPAAKDLVGRIRDAQNKDVDHLKDQLTARKEAQKALSKHAASLVDAETKGQNNPSDALRSIEVETKSNKLSVQTVREDFARLKKDTLLASERHSDLQKASKAHSDELVSLKRSQNDDYKLLVRTRDRVDALSDQLRKQTNDTSNDSKRLSRLDDDIYALKRSLDDQLEAKVEEYLRRRREPQKVLSSATQNNIKTLEDRIVGLEKRPLQSTSPTPEYDNLTKMVNNISSRLNEIETRHQHLTTVVEGLRSIHELKDNLLTQLVDDNHKKITQQLEDMVVRIKAEAASDLEKAMVQVKTEGVKSETGSMASLRESADIQDQRLQTVETAVISLEDRYKGFTPELLSLQVLPAIQRHYPPAAALHAIVERFPTVQMHLAQVGHIPALSATVENQARQLANLLTLMPRANQGTSHEIRSSIQTIQTNFSQLVGRLDELQSTLTARVDYLHAQSRNQNTPVAEFAENQPQSAAAQGATADGADGEQDLQAQTQAHDAAIAQSTEMNAAAVEEKLTDLIKEVENKVQNLEQKINDILGEHGLKETRLDLENLEVALQQHVDSLRQQITQLEDKQETTSSVIKFMTDRQKASDELNHSTLTTIEDLTKLVDGLKDQQSANDFQTKIEGIMGEVKEMTYRLQEIEQTKAILERKFGGSQSPRSERSPSPVSTNNRSEPLHLEEEEEEEEVQSNASDMNSMDSKSQRKNKKKRKHSKVFTSSPQSSLIDTASSTSQRTPGPGGLPKPSKRKKHHKLLNAVENASNGSAGK